MTDYVREMNRILRTPVDFLKILKFRKKVYNQEHLW